MSEATAATPDPEPLTLEGLIAAHTAQLAGAIAEMRALRRALDAAKFTPGRQLSDVALIIAIDRIADFEQAELAIGRHIADAAEWQTVQEMHEARQAALAEPAVRHGHRKPRTARQRGERPMFPRSLGGTLPVGVAAAWQVSRGTAKQALKLKPLAAAGAAAGIALTLPSMHTLEDRAVYIPPPPHSVTAPSVAPHLPAVQLASRNTDAQPVLRTRRAFARPAIIAAPLPAPVPVPVPTPAPAVTQPPSSQRSSWSGSDSSSQSYQSPQSSDWQAQGDHASQWSGTERRDPGSDDYQPRHGQNDSGSNYWQQGTRGGHGQDGGRQSGTWQNGSSQDASWQQSGGQQGNWQTGQQQGANWQQGGQDAGHGQQDGGGYPRHGH